LSVPAYSDSDADRVYRLYSDGKMEEAMRELGRLPQTATRDGNRLFVNALLESSGRAGREMLQAALRSNLDGKYQEEAYFRLIRLAEAAGDSVQVRTAATSFLDAWETSRYRGEVLAILATHLGIDVPERTRCLDLLESEFPGSYYGQFARLAKANQAFRKRQFKTADKLCQRLGDAANEDLTPTGLMLQARLSLENNNAEKALFYYGIINEQYPQAIGGDALFSSLKQVSQSRSDVESSEVFIGVTYSVQVGVYAEKDNAKTMADRVGQYGYKSRINRRRISGNDYYVVLAGKFPTVREAEKARQKLEAGENEVFKVVVNDE